MGETNSKEIDNLDLISSLIADLRSRASVDGGGLSISSDV